jgi:hypothetical protein
MIDPNNSPFAVRCAEVNYRKQHPKPRDPDEEFNDDWRYVL